MVDLPVAFRQILCLFVVANILCAFGFEHVLTAKATKDLKREFEMMQFEEQNLRKSITY